MAAEKPDPSVVRQAIDTYLRLAYDGQPPPVNVRSQLAILESWGGDFWTAPVFVTDTQKPPTRYNMRLGNKHYPHMKLVVQLSPNEDQWLFRADAHDRHCCPPANSPEYQDFCSLMERNQKVVEQVEAAWAAQGLPTFKTYLRQDLERRGRAVPDARGTSGTTPPPGAPPPPGTLPSGPPVTQSFA
jgi:hypothetical protein